MALALSLALAPAVFSAQRDTQKAQPGNEKQRRKAQQQERRAQPRPGKNTDAVAPRRGADNFQPGNAPDSPFLDRLRQMSPDDQRRFLEGNPRFRRMPGDRQQQIRENLRRWNAMSSEQKQDLIHRERVWQQMTLDQRQRVRQEILPRWQNMEAPRRQAIMRRLGVLRPLSEEEREAKLKDEAFLAGLNAEEREVLHTVAKLRLPPPGRDDPPSNPPQDEPLVP